MIWVGTHILKFLTLGTPDSPGQETIYNILPSVIVLGTPVITPIKTEQLEVWNNVAGPCQSSRFDFGGCNFK